MRVRAQFFGVGNLFCVAVARARRSLYIIDDYAQGKPTVSGLYSPESSPWSCLCARRTGEGAEEDFPSAAAAAAAASRIFF